MTVDTVLQRARSMCGQKVKYRLGGGSTRHGALFPWGEDGSCDCSAFVTWVYGIDKMQAQFVWLRKLNGGWLNTDGIWTDAQVETGYFEETATPMLGGCLVYPSARTAKTGGPKMGHCAIITGIDDNGKVSNIVDCSAGNFKRYNDAIREHSPDVFKAVPSCISAWCATVERNR